MKREERRRQLFSAAEVILERDGVAALTMERLAREAGISKPVVYSHFDDREALLLALLEDYWSYLDALVTQRVDESGSFEAQLRQSVSAYFEAVSTRGPALRILMHDLSYEPAVELARQNRHQQVEQRFTRSFRENFGLPKSIAAALAGINRSALEGASTYLLRNEGRREDVENTYVSFVLGGLEALARRHSGERFFRIRRAAEGS